MADDAIKVEVGAKDTGLSDTMQKSGSSVKDNCDKMLASIGQMVAGATSHFAHLDHTVAESANSINERLETIAGSINKIQHFLSLVGEVAMLGFIGEKIMDLAHEYAELGEQAEHAAKQTGMSTDAVQEWGYVGRSVHVSTETMNQGLERLSRTLLLARQGSGLAAAALKSVGISGKEVESINLDQALEKIAVAFHSHADGAEKEAIAMQLMKNSGVELIPVFDKGAEGIETLRQHAHEMGVVMSEEDVEAAAALHVQIMDLKEQTSGLGMNLGGKLVPALLASVTALMNTTKQGGLADTVITALAEGIKVLVSVALGGVAGIKQIGEAMMAVAVDAIFAVKGVGELAMAVGNFLTGNFDKAKEHWGEMQSDFRMGSDVLKQGWEKVNKTGTDYIETLKGIWGEQKKVHAADDGPGPNAPRLPVFKPQHGGEDQAAKIAAARLALEKAMDQAEYNELKGHLDDAQKLYDDAYANGLISVREYYDAQLAVQQRTLEAQIAMRQKEVAEAQKALGVAEAHKGSKGGEVAVLEARTRLVTLTGQLQVAENQLATSADMNARKREDAERKLNTQLAEDSIATQKKIGEQDIADTQAVIESKVSMNMMQKDKALELERDLIDQKFAIDKAALEKELALYSSDTFRDPVQVAKINNQLLALNRQYQSDLLANTISTQVEIRSSYTEMIGGISTAFQDGIAGMLDGTKSFAEGLRSIFTGILQAFDKMIAEKITKWIMGELQQTYATVTGNTTRTTASVVSEGTATAATAAGNSARVGLTVGAQGVMTAATAAGNTARQAADWEAATESVAATAWAAVKNIATKAWEAAASVYAAIAAIPYVGPFLAPAMAIAAAGLVIGFAGHIASAEGGYSIPAGVNPVTQLHEQEMVLPKAEANVIRNMASGAAQSGVSSGGDLHVHIHAMDANSFEKRLMQSGGTLQAMLREAQRNGLQGELRGTWGAVG